MDLTFWDFRTHFNTQEAANLIIGQEPGERQYEPAVAHRVRSITAEINAAAERAHLFAISSLQNIMPWDEGYPWSSEFPPGYLASVELMEFVESVHAGQSKPEWEHLMFYASGLEQFSREDLNEWVIHNNIRSVYDFSCSERNADRRAQEAFDNGFCEHSAVAVPGRREHQTETILAVCAALEFDPLKIPTGGKAKVRAACLTRPKLFTPAGFDDAWKAASKNGLIRMEDHEKFIAGRGGDQ